MDLKKPLDIQDQISELERHNITFDDKSEAERILNKISYYRLSGYWLKYKLLGKEVTLSHVYSLYKFDASLRTLLREYIERTEMFYKDLIGNEIAIIKCNAAPFDQHYDPNSYYDKQGIKNTLKNFEKEKKYYIDSDIVKHHKAKYADKMPLWVMLELMTYSSMSKYFHALYISDKQVVANKIGVSFKTLENHLHCLSVFRNKCAHGARLYNTKLNPPARFTKGFLRANPSIDNDSLFAYILVLVKRLPTDEDRIEFRDKLNRLIKKYEKDIDLADMGFPINYRELLYKKNLSKIQ